MSENVTEQESPSKSFDDFMESLDRNDNDSNAHQNNHEDASLHQEDTATKNGSFPLPGFEEQGVNGTQQERRFDERGYPINNSVQNGHRDHGMFLILFHYCFA